MRADVTSVIHLTSIEENREVYEEIAVGLGLSLVNAKSLEDVKWLSTRLNKFIIVISDPAFALGEIPVEAPVIHLGSEELILLKEIILKSF